MQHEYKVFPVTFSAFIPSENFSFFHFYATELTSHSFFFFTHNTSLLFSRTFVLKAHKRGRIQATENFKLGIAAATGGIFWFI